ncbi:MAG: iron permease [Chloroflexi bacterium HGW-Chloroflexi-8]|jgi:high-affinity iron transporter|nr:MAG: iron permease [Chloroflexi bacterium HGW-Chloroflexi-8]
MLPSYLLALREGLEAALIIGIVLSVLRKMDHQILNSAVWIGVINAIVISVLAALSLNWIGAEFEGRGEQLFEGITMFFAAGILTWMVFWMRNQSILMKQKIESSVRQATEVQRQKALFLLAFLAVVREGIELALFLLAIRGTTNPFQEYLGAGLGITSAALIGWAVFATTRKLSLTRFFQGTNVLLALFAAGLVGLGIHEFNELSWIPSIVENVWNFNSMLPDQSTVGQLLKALVGYNSSPSLSQVIGYFGYFLILALLFWVRRQKSLERDLKTTQKVD